MFNCTGCHKTTKPGEPAEKRVVKKRDKTYTNKDGKVSHGWEIVEEALLCPECAA